MYSKVLVLVVSVSILLGSCSNALAGTKLKVMTYNLQVGIPVWEELGKYTPGATDMDRQAKVINSTKADIIGLNEVDRYYGSPTASRSGYLHIAQELSKRTGKHYAYGSTRDDGDWPGPGMTDYIEWGKGTTWQSNRTPQGAYGNAQLTRFSITTVINYKLPMAKGNEQRCMLMTEQVFSNKTIHVYNAHLQNGTDTTQIMDRWNQATEIYRILSQDDNPNKILMGDFNWDNEIEGKRLKTNMPETQFMSLFTKLGLKDAAAALGKAPQKTYSADKPTIRLDYIFVSPAFKVLKAEVIKADASDHRPLAVELDIK